MGMFPSATAVDSESIFTDLDDRVPYRASHSAPANRDCYRHEGKRSLRMALLICMVESQHHVD